MTDERIPEAYLLAVERFARQYGEPLPRELLEIGDPNQGWHIKLNATRENTHDIPAYDLVCSWGGFPAGSMGPFGGIIACGKLANEDSFCEWLQSDLVEDANKTITYFEGMSDKTAGRLSEAFKLLAGSPDGEVRRTAAELVRALLRWSDL